MVRIAVNLQALSFLLVSILANAAVQFFLKTGGIKLGKVEVSNFWQHFEQAMVVPDLLAGVACSVVAALAYFIVLTSAELSVAGPASALVYIFSVLLGHFLFKEAVPLNHLAGLGLIVCGVVLVSSKA